ncbi:MAG: hypothetical protein PHG85_02355 [Candidatus Altiarchaeota archaeon]|nr:hypothetical protein [Candidatus Altiarchaeota archaeon]
MKTTSPAITALIIMLMSVTSCAISFDVSKSQLDYKSITPGSQVMLNVSLYIRSEKDTVCTVDVDENLKDWIIPNRNPVTLAPYTDTPIILILSVPRNATHKTYTGKIHFIIGETSQGSGMGLNIGLRIPVDVVFDVVSNITEVVYNNTLPRVVPTENGITINFDESNGGSRVLTLDYAVSLHSPSGVIAQSNSQYSIRPYSKHAFSMDLDTKNIPSGTYTLALLITSKGVQYAEYSQEVTIGSQAVITTIPTTEIPTTLAEESTTTIPQVAPTAENQPDTLPYAYITVGAAILILAAGILMLLRRAPKSPGV